MRKEDFLKKQTDKLGQILGFVLAKILKLKTENNISLKLMEILENFENEQGLNFENSVKLNNDDFKIQLHNNNITIENYESIALILFEIGVLKENYNDKLNYLNKAKLLFELTNKLGSTYSLQANIKLSEINKLLEK
ncbi:MAG: hypothetical protein LCH32_10555 [Bacteroidetes bacterium]|nr:hypothetical protein [Bacteroidota bacterium]